MALGIVFLLLLGVSVMAYAAGRQYYFTPRGGEAFVFNEIRDEVI